MKLRDLTILEVVAAIDLKVRCWDEELAQKASNTLDFNEEVLEWQTWVQTAEEHQDVRVFVGAFEGTTLLGTAAASYVEDRDNPEAGCELNGLWIETFARGQGLSRQLIEFVLRSFPDCPKMIVYSHHYAPSNSFYSHLGGRVVRQEWQMEGQLLVDVFEIELPLLQMR